ncbi:MAG: hypothetical protein EB084_17070 [Proteobacteria bacterium]|nr:hypothetical protein [Pseudomonadota bacterium]
MRCSYCEGISSAGARTCEGCGAPFPLGGSPLTSSGRAVQWQQWIDPTEGAFGLVIPSGWPARGGIDRNTPNGFPRSVFQVMNPSGSVGFQLGPEVYSFSEPASGGGWGESLFLGLMTGGMSHLLAEQMRAQAPQLPFQDAQSFVHTWLYPTWRTHWPDLTLVTAALNDEAQRAALARGQREVAMRAGLQGAQVACSVADVIVDHVLPDGSRVRRGARVEVSKLSIPFNPSVLWNAEVRAWWFAPVAEFPRWAPILRRVLDTATVNPSWQAAQVAQENAVVYRDSIDRSRRQQQISQTLRETSDVISRSYESKRQIQHEHEMNRQAAVGQHDWSREFSNATLGWEDRYDEHGNHYTVSNGTERLWRDNAGNLHEGNALTTPDPTWHELFRR